jgi:hypothetical protein
MKDQMKKRGWNNRFAILLWQLNVMAPLIWILSLMI